MTCLQLPSHDEGGPLPTAHALLEVDRLLPQRCPRKHAGEDRPARAPAPHPEPGKSPLKQDVRRPQKETREVEENGSEMPSTIGSSYLTGTRGSSSPPRERSHAILPERPNWSTRKPIRTDATSPQGVKTEAAHPSLHLTGDGKNVNQMGSKERRRISRHLRHTQRATGQSRDKRRELAVRHTGPRPLVPRHRTPQGSDQPALAPIQPLQTIKTHIGHAQPSPLHPVADPPQRGNHPVEHPPVHHLINLQDNSISILRQRHLQRHPRNHPDSTQETLDNHTSPP